MSNPDRSAEPTSGQYWCSRCGGVILPLRDAAVVLGKPYHDTDICNPLRTPASAPPEPRRTPLERLDTSLPDFGLQQQQDLDKTEKNQQHEPELKEERPMDANCITVGDGSCVAPDLCMHTAPLTPEERAVAVRLAVRPEGEWVPSVVNEILLRYEATVRALESRT